MATLSLDRPRRLGLVHRVVLSLALATALITAIVFGGIRFWQYQQLQRQTAAAHGAPQTELRELAIAEFAYAAPHVQVPVGATLTWTNSDEAAHDVTFRGDLASSPSLTADQSFSATFTTPGSFEYYCSDHPFMVGKVTVVR